MSLRSTLDPHQRAFARVVLRNTMPCCAIAAAILGQPFMLWAAIRAKLFGRARIAPVIRHPSSQSYAAQVLIVAGLAELILVGAGVAGASILVAGHAAATGNNFLLHICSVFGR